MMKKRKRKTKNKKGERTKKNTKKNKKKLSGERETCISRLQTKHQETGKGKGFHACARVARGGCVHGREKKHWAFGTLETHATCLHVCSRPFVAFGQKNTRLGRRPMFDQFAMRG